MLSAIVVLTVVAALCAAVAAFFSKNSSKVELVLLFNFMRRTTFSKTSRYILLTKKASRIARFDLN